MKKKKKNPNISKNTRLIYRVVKEFKQDARYKHIHFKVKKSKSTSSIYINLYSILDGKIVKRHRRFSDHSKSGLKQGGEILNKKITEEQIIKIIKRMIKSIEDQRLKILLK